MAVGTIMMISRVFDGISDIIMGVIVDRTHSRYRKSKTVDFAYVHPVCNIRSPDVFRSGFLVIHTETGIRLYHL